ncbi:hypothetical protein ANACAC_02108 [Anaerostipes caccae L1-92]|uniref:Uncharacterized protein n=1 Tax=Anaerostipes caccae (strain DSM 14662 / CCUG 47493 / JCM 13470 / NCIMB 13811 / L1-92) TaxID=411490 RepID=B0MEV8_ANACD|nr:hypothetical protein ANACAC_02108 [Anaerostipes caccae L1-92]
MKIFLYLFVDDNNKCICDAEVIEKTGFKRRRTLYFSVSLC